jgi:hypothetical protein
MRLMLGTTIGLLALTGLAACGQSEEGLRTAFRTQGTANCKAGADPASRARLTEIGMSVDELCTCAIDSYLRTATFEQLKQDRNNPAPPALVRATAQCVTDHAARSGAAPDTGANAATAAPAAPAEAGATEEHEGAEGNGAAEE